MRTVAPRSFRPSYVRPPVRVTETLPGPIRSLTWCACSLMGSPVIAVGAASIMRHSGAGIRGSCDVAGRCVGRDTPGLHGCRDCGKLVGFNISNACTRAR
ncbi:hypothetical protein GCM10009749_19820 [Agromyces neolithicus]|uniref:Uncharacterized protein n=1 Tax=Agromyces neolithicus TaxID=269420 RepID=A0ABN2M6W4_9MICO